MASPHLGGVPLTVPSLGARPSRFSRGPTHGLVEQGGSAADRELWGEGLGCPRRGIPRLPHDRMTKQTGGSLLFHRGLGGGSSSGRWDGDTLCAVIENSAWPSQRVWRATLSTLVGKIWADSWDRWRMSVNSAVLAVGPTASLDLLAQWHSGHCTAFLDDAKESGQESRLCRSVGAGFSETER